MSVMNNADIAKLLQEVKAYLGITWIDEDNDNLLRSYIRMSAKRFLAEI